jgi:hypothetical protein
VNEGDIDPKATVEFVVVNHEKGRPDKNTHKNVKEMESFVS